MFGDPATTNSDDNLTNNLFGLAGEGLNVFGAVQVSKNNAKALSKTPPASIGIIVLGVVLIVGMFAFGGRKR